MADGRNGRRKRGALVEKGRGKTKERTNVGERQKPRVVVRDGSFESLPVRELLVVRGGSNEPHNGKSSLVGGEELGRVREVGKNEDGGDGNANGCETFDDELKEEEGRLVRQ